MRQRDLEREYQELEQEYNDIEQQQNQELDLRQELHDLLIVLQEQELRENTRSRSLFPPPSPHGMDDWIRILRFLYIDNAPPYPWEYMFRHLNQNLKDTYELENENHPHPYVKESLFRFCPNGHEVEF